MMPPFLASPVATDEGEGSAELLRVSNMTLALVPSPTRGVPQRARHYDYPAFKSTTLDCRV